MGLTLDEGLKIIALCERIGMPWEWHPKRDDSEFAWNGKALNIAHHSPNGTSDIVHEMAHWLVAPPEAREQDDFGLETISSYEESTEEETCASVLGILIERHLGLNWRYTWEFHSWHWLDRPSKRGWIARPEARKLQQRGLLRGLTPTCMPHATSRRMGR